MSLLRRIVMALRFGEMPLHLAIEIEAPGALVAAWDHGDTSSIVEIRMFVDAGDLLRDLEELCDYADLIANELDSYGSAQTYAETAHLTVQERHSQFGKFVGELFGPIDWLQMASKEAFEVVKLLRRPDDQRVIVKLRDGGPPSLAALIDAIQRNGGKW
jgi:hypothetical protein